MDHVIALNEEHLRRLIRDYVTYHHGDSIIQLTYTSATPEPDSGTMAVTGAFLLLWIGWRRQSRAHTRRFSMR